MSYAALRFAELFAKKAALEYQKTTSFVMTTLITSKFFCPLSNHFRCEHDWDPDTFEICERVETMSACRLPDYSAAMNVTGEKDEIIRELLSELTLTRQQSESYWQNKLQKALSHMSIGRQRLQRHRYVTDLSNSEVLIEIKNQKDFRAAFGQVADYSYGQTRACLKYILLFGEKRNWSPDLWRDRQKICEAQGIRLRWLTG